MKKLYCMNCSAQIKGTIPNKCSCGAEIDLAAYKKRYGEIGLEMPANVEAFLEEFGMSPLLKDLKHGLADVNIYNPLESI